MKTNWDLKLFYQSDNDPQIQKDVDSNTNDVKVFVEKYKNTDTYLKDENALLEALIEYEKLVESIDAAKPLLYFYLKKYLDSSDSKAEAMINKLSDLYTKLENEILFFDLNIGKIPNELHSKFLASEKLSHFHYHLKTLFDVAKHQLSEKEEQILNLKSLPSHSLWVNGGEKLACKQMIKFGSGFIPLSEAIYKVQTLDSKDRRKLHEKIVKKLEEISDYSENEMNAIILDKKINDELRKFKKPYESRFLGDEVTEKEIMAMIEAVTKHFSISHKFYNLKFKLLKIRKPKYADRSVEYGEIKKKYSFEDSVGIMKNLYGKLGERYSSILNKFLENGQIDVYPKKGKLGGAYCFDLTNLPTFVLLNHVDSYDSLRTFAHEMGHAIHSEFSKCQTPLYQGYSLAAAETASTMFEDFLFGEIYKSANLEEQRILIHSRLGNDNASIFRQVALFNFEMELHEKVRKDGFVSKEEIAKLMNKHMQSYLGPKFSLTKEDGYYYVNWSHIRSFFYVYSYAYGRLISRALHQRYKEDNSYLSEIEKFLCAGGSDSPHNIFLKIGIDTYDPKFWEEGLVSIEKEIDEFERLLKQK